LICWPYFPIKLSISQHVLIYVDDLVEVLLQYGVRVVKIFADDMKVYVEISHDRTVNELQTVLGIIYAWATVWQLQVQIMCRIIMIIR